MKSTPVVEYWNKQALNLRLLADILSREVPTLCPDLTPLYDAAAICDCGVRKKRFSYYLEGLQFRIKSEGHIPSCAPQDVTVTLSVRVKGQLQILDYDPFNDLELNVILNAGVDRKYIGAWHLDRHIGETVYDGRCLHPLYHFHFGGHHLKELDDDVGSLLILDSPRLPHHPMDVFLGIDFVLANYAGADWAKLKENRTYLNCLKRSQDFLLATHIKSLNTHFGTPDEKNEGGASCLWPHLLPHEH